jgi:antirestriction protein ArdC
MNKKQEEIYAGLTNRVIEAIETNSFGQWLAKFSVTGKAYNPVTKKAYQGSNQLILMFEAEEKNYTSNRWVTYKQATDAGGNIKKGEKSTSVWFWQFTKKEKEGDEETSRSIPLFKLYWVFNLDQTEGLDHLRADAGVLNFEDRREEVDSFLSTIPHAVKTNDTLPHFSVGKDCIFLPPVSSVKSGNIEEYYSSYFHELIHWTGHQTRLNRIKESHEGEAYAFEELVAELGSLFLCAEFGFQTKLQHTEYLGAWLTKLKGDTSYIIKASKEAEKAIKFLKDSVLEERKVA